MLQETNDSGDLDTFADLDVPNEGEEQGMDMDLHQDNWDIPIESPKAAKVNKKSTEQTENLDSEEGDLTDDGVKMKGKPKKDEELTDEELEAKETAAAESKAIKAEEEAAEVVPVGKIMKAKLGDKDIEFDTGLVVRQKIDGKMADVKIQDALEAYSGKISYDKKFKELSDEKKASTDVVNKVKAYEANIKKEMGTIQKLVKDASEGKASPFQAMQHLLDLQGEDSFVYYKKAMESMFDDFEKLYDMDENQQNAWWTAKENEHLRKQQTRISQSRQQEQDNQKVISQVEAVQNEFGVDWDQFNEALDYLAGLKDGAGKAIYQEQALMNNPRGVAQYAARMPYITKAESLVKEFEENIDDSQIVLISKEVTELLYESKGKSEAEVREWLETNYGVSSAVKALNQKILKSGGGAQKSGDENAKYKAKTKQKEIEDDVDMFDDFDLDP